MMDKFVKGDYNTNHCELWVDDEWFGDVRTDDADKFIDLINGLIKENNELKRLKFLELKGSDSSWKGNRNDDGLLQASASIISCSWLRNRSRASREEVKDKTLDLMGSLRFSSETLRILIV